MEVAYGALTVTGFEYEHLGKVFCFSRALVTWVNRLSQVGCVGGLRCPGDILYFGDIVTQWSIESTQVLLSFKTDFSAFGCLLFHRKIK